MNQSPPARIVWKFFVLQFQRFAITLLAVSYMATQSTAKEAVDGNIGHDT
jgi:hypothetical protein